jgi:hypothetical protein
MREIIVMSWNSVMDADTNPLRHIKDIHTRHLILQLLAFMWCVSFSVMVSSWWFFSISVLAHSLLIASIVVTVVIFEKASRDPNFFVFRKGYHSSGRSRKHMWINGEKFILPDGDPGGEHE